MRFEFETGPEKELAVITPSAEYGSFIVSSAARAVRVVNEMKYFGLTAETIESLRSNMQDISELFNLTESGVFKPKSNEGLLTANILNDGSTVEEIVRVDSFTEVLPVTPKNIRYT